MEESICPKWDECSKFKCHDEQVCLNADYWAKYWGSKERASLMATVPKPQKKPKRYKKNWKGICHYCERKLVGNLISTRDHLIPVAQDGSNDPRNGVESCERCNTLKGNRTPDQFAIQLGYWIMEGKEGVDKDTLITILYNTRKLIFEIAPYRHELIKPKLQFVDTPAVKIKKSKVDPLEPVRKEKPILSPQGTIINKPITNELKNWLDNHYYPNLHPDPTTFHEK